MDETAPRKARVPTAISAAAAVTNRVIDSVIASGSAKLQLSDEVLEKLRIGWRDRYNEISGFTEEEIAQENAERKRSLSSSDDHGVRDGGSDPDLSEDADQLPSAAAAAGNGAAAAGGGGDAVPAPAASIGLGSAAPFMPAPPAAVETTELRRQKRIEKAKMMRARIAAKAEKAARKAALEAAAKAPPVPVTEKFTADCLLMGTYTQHVRSNREDDTMVVRVENAMLRGKSRDFVLGSVKCLLRLEQLHDMPHTSEEDLDFFARAPAEEAVLEQERLENERQKKGELDFSDVQLDQLPAAAVSAVSEADDAGFGALKRARGRPRKQKQQQNNAAGKQNGSNSSRSSCSGAISSERAAAYTAFGAAFLEAQGGVSGSFGTAAAAAVVKEDLHDPMDVALAASAKLMSNTSTTAAAADYDPFAAILSAVASKPPAAGGGSGSGSRAATSSTFARPTTAAAAFDDPFAAAISAAASKPAADTTDSTDAADEGDSDLDAELNALNSTATTATATKAFSTAVDEPFGAALTAAADEAPTVRAVKTGDGVVDAMLQAGEFDQYNPYDAKYKQ
jgi:hypothetical protein